MPNRTFRDPDGLVWEAWDVYPGHHSNEAQQAARNLPDGMGAGWLCFQSDREKRRLMPIPERWEDVEEEKLREYCRVAQPVTSRPRQRR